MFSTGLQFSELKWRKARRSLGNGECVEVASLETARVAVRDSKMPAGAVVLYSAPEWRSFLADIKGRAPEV
jgi:Domain of unknown function (DUF397)